MFLRMKGEVEKCDVNRCRSNVVMMQQICQQTLVAKVQQPTGCLEIPLVVEPIVHPSCSSFWVPHTAFAAKESASEAGYRGTSAHARNKESIARRGGETSKEASRTPHCPLRLQQDSTLVIRLFKMFFQITRIHPVSKMPDARGTLQH